jgi:hypothetical protein
MKNSYPTCRQRTPAAAALLGAMASAVAAHAQPNADLAPLFDGSLTGWTIENTALGNFSIAGGVLKVEGTQGWLKSARRYTDFRLRIEFRFLTDDGDSGIFVRAAGDATFGRGWPNDSYQLQILNPAAENPRFPPLGHLFRHGTPAGDIAFDLAAARAAFTGIGEWQMLDIEVDGTELTAHLNGTLVTRASNLVDRSGYIGIQGETGALEFRAIKIDER